MKVRLIKNPRITGTANRFNTGSPAGEVIMGFDGGDMDSMFISELEVLIKDKWIPLSQAFENHILIIDNFNTEFFEPMNDEERRMGYRLTAYDLMKLKAEAYD